MASQLLFTSLKRTYALGKNLKWSVILYKIYTYVKTQLFSQNWNITSKIFGSNFVLDIESKVDGQWILALTHCPTLIRKSVVAFLDLKKKKKKMFANQFHKDISKYGMLFIWISS